MQILIEKMKATTFFLVFLCSVPSFGQHVISIDDSLMYDSKFLSKLETGEYFKEQCQSVELENGLMILNTNDTIHFPRELELGKVEVFVGKNESYDLTFEVQRINNTTIKYRLEIIYLGKHQVVIKSEAFIEPYFFFGAESEEFEGSTYFVDEYQYIDGDCYFNVGIGETDSGIRMATIHGNCLGSLEDIDSEAFPRLRSN